MKTFLLVLLKITLLAIVMWWLLHNAPLIMAPIAGVFFALMGFVAVLVGALTIGATLGLSVLIGIGIVALVMATALAPIWFPLLAIVGVVMLCRARPAKTA
jgi:hypothetical protein